MGYYLYLPSMFVHNVPMFNDSNWVKYSFVYLSIEVRSIKDHVKLYIWKKGKNPFHLKDVKIEIFEKK